MHNIESRLEMTAMTQIHRITVKPGVCGGRPTVRGMRIRVKDVLDLLGELIACIRHHASESDGERDTFDPTVLDGFREAPAFMRHLIDQFVDEACSGVRALKEAAGRADAHALHAIAHTLRGSSMIMGASRLAALCAQVEEQGTQTPVGEVVAARMVDIDQELLRSDMATCAEPSCVEDLLSYGPTLLRRWRRASPLSRSWRGHEDRHERRPA
jgi:HPt (histidine-containing phosphotransfer) domain-containing protein